MKAITPRFDAGVISKAQPRTSTEPFADLRAAFEHRFPTHSGPLWFNSAAGRINLIGEHVDYADGFSLPAATNRKIDGAFQPISAADPDARKVIVYSKQFNHPVEVDIDRIPDLPTSDWGRYVASSVKVLKAYADEQRVPLVGMRGVIDSNIPTGSGISSSAALELLILNSLVRFSGLKMDAPTLAKLGQQAEWDFGVKCGILDQLAIATGRAGQVSLVDARAGTATPVPVQLGGYDLVLGFTQPRRLHGSEYEQRRHEVEEAARLFRESTGENITALRDVTPEWFEANQGLLADPRLNPEGLPLQQRARHVVSENARTLEAVEALATGDVPRFNRLMNETHDSLSKDFQVSSPELNAMVDAAREYGARHGVSIGGRMMGGGFGGPALMVVPSEHAAPFKEAVAHGYRERTGTDGQLWDMKLEDGLTIREPS